MAPVDTEQSDQQRILDEKGWVRRFLLALRFETDKPVVVGISGAAVKQVSPWRWPPTSGSLPTPRLHPGYLRAGASPDGGLTWSLPTLVGHEHATSCSSPASWTPTRPSRPASSRRSSPPTNSMDGSWSSARPSPSKRRSPAARQRLVAERH